MSNTDLKNIELSISSAQKQVDMGNALERLYNNRDFKKIITEGLFEQEAIRLVHLKADPNMQSAVSQQSILTQMDSIGSFKQYLQVISFKASMADKAIQSDEAMRDELIAEGL